VVSKLLWLPPHPARTNFVVSKKKGVGGGSSKNPYPRRLSPPQNSLWAGPLFVGEEIHVSVGKKEEKE